MLWWFGKSASAPLKWMLFYSMDCTACVSASTAPVGWSFLAFSVAFCPLVDAKTRGVAGCIHLPGYSGASLKCKKLAMQRNVCHPRQRNFSKSEPYAGSNFLVTICFMDSFEELIKLKRGLLRCFTNQEDRDLHFSEVICRSLGLEELWPT